MAATKTFGVRSILSRISCACSTVITRCSCVLFLKLLMSAPAEKKRGAIEAAAAAFPAWSKTPGHKRAHILMHAAACVRERLDEVARLLTSEQGKPIRDSKIEAERFADNIEIYAGLNAGEACLAIKRVYVFESVADEFIDRIAARAKRLKLGSGTDPSAQMGPLHTEKQRAEIEAQLADAVQRGGKVVAGGKRPEGEQFERGYFFEPTVVVDVPEGARVWTEETFGPLLPIMRVKDLDEALEKANESEFGLGSSIFTPLASVPSINRGTRLSKIALAPMAVQITS